MGLIIYLYLFKLGKKEKNRTGAHGDARAAKRIFFGTFSSKIVRGTGDK